jgi:hypothetical protein
LLLLSLLLLPNLALRTKHGIHEVLLIDLPLFFGTTLSIASFYIMSQREIARLRAARLGNGARPELGRATFAALKRLPLVLSLGIGLCVNQTRAVFEALLGRETEFVRTPKHGIRGRLESWSSKKYRAARSVTPLIEVALALYFLETMVIAFQHGHYLSMPFLGLFLCGFGYVGVLSVWQGRLGQILRQLRPEAASLVMPPPPAYPNLVVPGMPVLAQSASSAFETSYRTSPLQETDTLGAVRPRASTVRL